MKTTIPLSEHDEARVERARQVGSLQAIEGVLQRVNYRTGEVKLVSPGKVWYFRVGPDCQLFFDDKHAILRCFHTLDPVRVVFVPDDQQPQARALYAWEQP